MTGDSHKSKKLSCWVTALLVTGSVLLVVFIIIYFTIWHTPDRRAEADKVRKMVEEKIEKGMAVPPEQNAWTYYEEAIGKFKWQEDKSGKNEEELLNIFNSGITEKNADIVNQHIENNRESLELADKAFKTNHFQVIRDYKKGEWLGMGEQVPNGISLMDFVEFLCISGEYEALKGNRQQAAKYFMQALYLSKGTSRNGKFVYFSESLSTISLSKLRKLINSSENAIKCKYIIEEMERIDKIHPEAADIFNQEILSIHYFLVNMRKGTGSTSKHHPLTMPLHNREEKLLYNLILDMTATDLSNYRKTKKNFKIQQEKVSNFSLWTKLYSHRYPQLYEVYIRGRVEYGGTMLLAALKRYKAEKGEYPDGLSQLVPKYIKKLPYDLYSKDWKYIYKKDGDNILLYSIGEDLKDDGSKVESKEPDEPGDIVFTPVGI